MAKRLLALIAGLVFGIGLAVSGMVLPQRVLGFLDLGALSAGQWNPSLAFVMAGALLVALPGFFWLRRRAHPAFADAFHWPQRRDIDGTLILGAALFGAGWGWAGLCPGPALAALVLAPLPAAIFFIAMLTGLALARRRNR